jgi:hypothetical protein
MPMGALVAIGVVAATSHSHSDGNVCGSEPPDRGRLVTSDNVTCTIPSTTIA